MNITHFFHRNGEDNGESSSFETTGLKRMRDTQNDDINNNRKNRCKSKYSVKCIH